MPLFAHDGLDFQYRDIGRGTPLFFQHGLGGYSPPQLNPRAIGLHQPRTGGSGISVRPDTPGDSELPMPTGWQVRVRARPSASLRRGHAVPVSDRMAARRLTPELTLHVPLPTRPSASHWARPCR